MITSQEEFDGTEVAEKIFYMTIVKHALQAHSSSDGGMCHAGRSFAHFAAGIDVLHFQTVAANDVVSVARGIGAGFVSMEESQQHASGFKQRSQTFHDGFDQAFIQIISQVPAQHHIKLSGAVGQVICQEAFAIQSWVAGIVFDGERRIG